MPRNDPSPFHRAQILVQYDDGKSVIVNVDRPAVLVAFHDEFGRAEPESMREMAWLVHRAIRDERPLDEWLDTIDLMTGDDEEIEKAIEAGIKRPTRTPAASGGK